jgi:hypothetical protein
MAFRFILPLVYSLCCSAALAAPAREPVRAEIEALLARLAASGCKFQRNGAWYEGAQAQAHLLRKLESAGKRGTLQSTEQFIELVGSASSTSGEAYQVRCGAHAAEPSRRWLTRELSAVRAAQPQVRR